MLFFNATAIGDDIVTTFFDEDKIEMLYNKFAEDVKTQLSLDAFKQTAQQITAAYGDVVSTEPLQTLPFGEGTVSSLLFFFKDETLLMKMVETASGEITGFSFTPYESATFLPKYEYKLPEGISETEVTIGSRWELPGVLTMPDNAENIPAVVLVHGSGPNDRNETIGQTAIFKDIAHTLAKHGIASLRYDKRTYVHGEKMIASQITIEEETIVDAILAGQLLQELPQIDSNRIFVLGHSLGGMMAPRVVDEGKGLFTGMIIAAGTPKPLDEIIIAQNLAVISHLDGKSREVAMKQLDEEKGRLENVYMLSEEDMRNEIVFGMPAYYLYEMKCINPVDLIHRMKVPTLILHGGGDFQVTPEDGIDAYKKLLGNPNYVTYALFNDLNHVFTASYDTQSVEDYNVALDIDSDVTKTIIDFINAN